MKFLSEKVLPPDIRGGLVMFAMFCRARQQEKWADHFLKMIPRAGIPRMGEIFIAATRGLPSRRESYDSLVEFHFVHNAEWRLKVNLYCNAWAEISHSCPCNDAGILSIRTNILVDEWGKIAAPESGCRIDNKDFRGVQFLPGDWSGYQFWNCQFFGETFPEELSGDQPAQFIKCKGGGGKHFRE